MCGIIGYIGDKKAQDVILKGLSRLEYRGYDSAGAAIIDQKGIDLAKRQGKLKVLAEELNTHPISGTIGIGHTRWATHGIPNDRNAHPHTDCKGKIAVVHNGIIENYLEIKESLLKEGHKFSSQTDTEVIPHLIEKFYKGDLEKAVLKAVKVLKGSYAIAVIHKDSPDRIVGARFDSPLVVGLGEGENFLASDVPAVLDHTNKVIYLDNNEVVSITKKSARVSDISGGIINKKTVTIKWDISAAEKGGYPHFMLKEIFEQADILRKILDERILKGRISFDELKIKDSDLKRIKKISIIACGTAYHAGLTGSYMLEEYAKLPVWVDTSSEFRYRNPALDKDTLTIIVSQSGETADSLAALREAKKRGSITLGICNVLGSSIAREADGVIYTHAGPEIAVASTKAYTAQLTILCLFTLYMAGLRRTITPARRTRILKEFARVPGCMDDLLWEYKSEYNEIAAYAQEFKRYYIEKKHKSYFLFLGRNINFPNALEGALKLKEISYIIAEGYPAGEMKHGPIALIDENPWVVCIATQSKTYDKMLSNIQEIKARGGIIIAIATEGDKEIMHHKVNYVLEIPKVAEIFSPLLVVIPLQLLAYYVAKEFGYDIDQPRNLAKSVTVE